ncbi:unnamed protein product [Amaranthus hypochondriacus]
MASEAPSWADQWGEGGFGAMDEVKTVQNKDTNKKKTSFFGGFKAGIKWVKQQCVKKNPHPK